MSVFDPSRKFLDPERVLFSAGLGLGHNFADFGAGSGFYVIAASKIVGDNGVVYGIDILESALDHMSAEARLHNRRNIKTLMCNLEQRKSCEGIVEGSLDMVLMGNILHQVKDRASLFTEAYRLLKTGSKLVTIEWNDQPVSIGPVATSRVAEHEVVNVALKNGFKQAGKLNVDPYHYGLIFIK